MKRIHIILLVITIFLVSSCVSHTTKKEAFPKMYNEKPLSLLVLPPINVTTAADAKEYYSTTIAEPLTEMGYYVFPIEVTSEILKSQGLYDTELVVNMPMQKFKQYFGADAVLFIKITKWNTSYYVIGGNLTVSVDCFIKSTSTDEVIWKYDGTIVLDTSGGSGGGGGIAGLLVKAVATAIRTATADYTPLARQANFVTMSSMPYGKYHPNYTKDGDYQIIKKGQAGER